METVVAFTNLNSTEATQNCPVLRLHGRAMELKVPRRMAIGSAVKVEADDTLSLGEVSGCRPEGDGYVVWVELVEALHDANELSRLAHALIT